MNRYGRFLGLTAGAIVATAASADAVFHIWIEAPAEVQAGSTFALSVWGEVSGSILNESDGGMHFVSADLLASGVDAEFSSASAPFMNLVWDAGKPEPNALRGVLISNEPHLLTFDDRNPLRLFDVEVTTDASAHGPLELTVAPALGASFTNILSWWLDHGESTGVRDDDPGSTRIITPATVQVIPAPASLGLLALAGVAAMRRRRAMT